MPRPTKRQQLMKKQGDAQTEFNQRKNAHARLVFGREKRRNVGQVNSLISVTKGKLAWLSAKIELAQFEKTEAQRRGNSKEVDAWKKVIGRIEKESRHLERQLADYKGQLKELLDKNSKGK